MKNSYNECDILCFSDDNNFRGGDNNINETLLVERDKRRVVERRGRANLTTDKGKLCKLVTLQHYSLPSLYLIVIFQALYPVLVRSNPYLSQVKL